MLKVNTSRICNLVTLKQMEETSDGKIDLDSEKNSEYLKSREVNVPKYSGKSEENEEQNKNSNPIDAVQLDLIENGGELDLSKITNKKDAELSLSLIKLSKEQKTNQLLAIKLQEKAKQVVSTEVLEKVIQTSFRFFYEGLERRPAQIIDKLRGIILSGQYENNEDLKFLKETYKNLYIDALNQAKKAMSDFYGDEFKVGAS